MFFSILAVLSLFFQSGTTGYVIFSIDNNYSDITNFDLKEDYTYTWIPGNSGTLKSIKLDGVISKRGTVRVYLEDGNDSYIIFDSDLLNKEDEVAPNINSQISSEILTNSNGESADKIIVLDLLQVGSLSIPEFKIVPQFNWNVDYGHICTRWEINDLSLCYGASDCCSLIELESLGDWNESLYLSQGRYGVGLQNTLNMQVIYADYSLDIENPYAEIIYSNEETTDFEVQAPKTHVEFNDICLDTCFLPTLNSTEYKLRFEIDGADIVINNIDYTIKSNFDTSVNRPKLVKEFEDITIYKNEFFSLNLSKYLSKLGELNLSYSSFGSSEIMIHIEDGVATMIPVYNFTGKTKVYFHHGKNRKICYDFVSL